MTVKGLLCARVRAGGCRNRGPSAKPRTGGLSPARPAYVAFPMIEPWQLLYQNMIQSAFGPFRTKIHRVSGENRDLQKGGAMARLTKITDKFQVPAEHHAIFDAIVKS